MEMSSSGEKRSCFTADIHAPTSRRRVATEAKSLQDEVCDNDDNDDGGVAGKKKNRRDTTSGAREELIDHRSIIFLKIKKKYKNR